MGEGTEVPKQDVITRDVESSEATVAEVRKEVVPTEVGASVPIDRLPLKQNLVMMVNAGVTTAAFGSTDRCIRVITVPARGGGSVQCHCSRPCVRVGTDKLCPDHDGAAFQPTQTPVAKGRSFNSASIKLGKAELKDCGLEEDPSLSAAQPSSPAPVAATPRSGNGTSAPSAAISMQLSFTLEELASGNILGVFQNRVCEALDGLPCNTRKQMKQMDAIQAKIMKLGRRAKMKALKPKEGTTDDTE